MSWLVRLDKSLIHRMTFFFFIYIVDKEKKKNKKKEIKS